MRQTVLALFILSCSVTLVAAQPKDTFDSAVSFTVSLSRLEEMVSDGTLNGVDTEKTYILDGIIAGVVVLDPDPETFLARIDLVTGAWEGLDKIDTYKAYVMVSGPSFAERIPRRMPRNPGPEIISANSRVMIAGSVIDVAYDRMIGKPVPVIDGFYVRSLQ